MNRPEEKPCLILGAGGHAQVTADTLLSMGRLVLGFVDPHPQFQSWQKIPYLGSESILEDYRAKDVLLANGIGQLPGQNQRQQAFEKHKAKGYRFISVIHPSAVLGRALHMEEGVQIFAKAVIQTGTVVGSNTLINTGAQLDHHCHIGPHCHIAPGAILCGRVALAQNVHVSPGATIIQGIDVGTHAIIGAGANVTKDIPANTTVYPAKVYIEENT